MSTDGEAQVVRLHGLIHGDYKVRARLTLANGDEICSPVQSLKVLPPPANFLPVSFEVNKGQTDKTVLFLGRCRNQIVRITANETHIATPVPRQANPSIERAGKDSGYYSLQTDHFRLVGANAASVPTGQKKLPGVSNYFLGNKPENWRTNIEQYREVISRDVYPGIDLVHHSNRGRLEYDFRVAPGKDLSPICVEFSDATGLTIDADGALVIKKASVELRHAAPVTYQKLNGQLCAVKSAWVFKGNRQAGFVLDDYDVREELVIDPLLFATYHGGTGNEGTNSAIAADSAGNVYINSSTSSVDFPVASPLDGTIGGTADLSVTKISSAGVLVYATYVGGSLDEGVVGSNCRSVAVDSAGNVYFTGRTDSTDYPLVSPAQPAMGSSQDAVVTKLNAARNALLFSTYLGGGTSDGGNAIAVDATNAIYVGGETGGSFPTTPGALQTTFGGGIYDGFVVKYTPAGTIAYATYLGGNN